MEKNIDKIDLQNVTILYVDDEQLNLFLFERNLGTEFPVLTAESGPEALEVLKDKHDVIVVVISDFMMPEMNGLEFIKKAQSQYSHIIYMMLTGYSSNEEVAHALESNIIYECFSKPFNMDQIEKKIKEAITTL